MLEVLWLIGIGSLEGEGMVLFAHPCHMEWPPYNGGLPWSAIGRVGVSSLSEPKAGSSGLLWQDGGEPVSLQGLPQGRPSEPQAHTPRARREGQSP